MPHHLLSGRLQGMLKRLRVTGSVTIGMEIEVQRLRGFG
jgi:hypothetical protein